MFKVFVLALLALYTNCFKTKGIDVNAWQGPNIDFAKVKAAGNTFVILRAGTGAGNKDKYFETNYRKAKAAGLNIGAYWYSYASTPSDGINEANHFVNIISGKKFEYPLFYDVEESSVFDLGISNTIIENFCSVLERKNYLCGIFSTAEKINTYFSYDIKRKYSLWASEYGVETCSVDKYTLWQKKNDGKIDGNDGDFCIDEATQDFPLIIKNAGLNGY